jgi:RNA-directed DNA polymerase
LATSLGSMNLVRTGMTRRRKGATYPLPHLYGQFGLVGLTALASNVPWAKA